MTRKEEDAQTGPKTDGGTEKSEKEDFARRRRKLIAYAFLTGFGKDRRWEGYPYQSDPPSPPS